jgi:hypothetical protein
LKTNRFIFAAFVLSAAPCLAPCSAPAQEQADDPCLSNERCNNLYESALTLSKAGQFSAALSNYQDAYALKPVPWLLINIGRVQQKMGRPKEAMASYQQFLDSPGAQVDPEMLVTARQYKKQAAQDISHPKHVSFIVMKEDRAPRPLWRMLLGGGLVAGGASMLIPGAYNLGVDGKCVDEPMAPALNCPTLYAGVTTGAPLVAVGLLTIAAGVVTIALPGKFIYRPVFQGAEPPPS